MLNIIEAVPAGLLEAEAAELHSLLKQPTLLHLPGRRAQPVLVSCLLHGNETTGWLAVREVLRRYQAKPLPRSLSVLLGNVSAAEQGLRRHDAQPDYNRIWKTGDTPEHAMAQVVLEEMRNRDVFAAVDIHNNTGRNPHYACVNVLDNRYLHLAQLFSRTVVYFIKPDTVASIAFSAICPALTIECGQPGDALGVAKATALIDDLLHLSAHPVQAVAGHDIDLFHTTTTVRVADDVRFGFTADGNALWFANDLEGMNFRELAAGTLFGWVEDATALPVMVTDEGGNDVSRRYFELVGNELRTRLPVMPSMLSEDARVIRQDCLCYFMERYRLPGPVDPGA